VKTIGAVPAGLPPLRIPSFDLDRLSTLIANAAGIALIAFSSLVITARSFAARNRYDVDVDREFSALGAANIASALSQGFAVSGADSRTAMGEAAGGRTQVTGLVATAAVTVILLFFTAPLQYVPIAALGAVLIIAAASLVDLPALKQIYRLDRREFALSIAVTLGVVIVDSIEAIGLAVALALLRFVRLVSRPPVELLGEVPGLPGLHSIARHEGAAQREGKVILRFNGPIVFFNAPFFKREALAAAEAAGPDLKVFILDMLPITLVDATGFYTAEEVVETLAERGVVTAFAGRQTEWRQWSQRHGIATESWKARFYPTLREALRATDSEDVAEQRPKDS
jgi:MFS superfamily sulfate permease-like transporter